MLQIFVLKNTVKLALKTVFKRHLVNCARDNLDCTSQNQINCATKLLEISSKLWNSSYNSCTAFNTCWNATFLPPWDLLASPACHCFDNYPSAANLHTCCVNDSKSIQAVSHFGCKLTVQSWNWACVEIPKHAVNLDGFQFYSWRFQRVCVMCVALFK